MLCNLSHDMFVCFLHLGQPSLSVYKVLPKSKQTGQLKWLKAHSANILKAQGLLGNQNLCNAILILGIFFHLPALGLLEEQDIRWDLSKTSLSKHSRDPITPVSLWKMPPMQGLRETSVTPPSNPFPPDPICLFIDLLGDEESLCKFFLLHLLFSDSSLQRGWITFCFSGPFCFLVRWRSYLIPSLLHSGEASIYHLILPVEWQKSPGFLPRAGSQPAQRESKFWSWSPEH